MTVGFMNKPSQIRSTTLDMAAEIWKHFEVQQLGQMRTLTVVATYYLDPTF